MVVIFLSFYSKLRTNAFDLFNFNGFLCFVFIRTSVKFN